MLTRLSTLWDAQAGTLEVRYTTSLVPPNGNITDLQACIAQTFEQMDRLLHRLRIHERDVLHDQMSSNVDAVTRCLGWTCSVRVHPRPLQGPSERARGK